MAKKILGIDIGYDSVKLALCKDGEIKKIAVAELPSNMLQDGHIVSPEILSELIRSTMRKNRMRASRAAVVLPNEQTYLRTVTLPRMTVAQLKTNIPYEFNDYLEDEVKNYVFDYAMLSDPKSDPEGETMELMAVAAPAHMISEAKEMLSMANMKLVKAAPVEYAYIPLIRRAEKGKDALQDYCILDLGYRSIRMFMYHGDRHMVTRVLETGMRSVDEAVAEALGIEVGLAHTFFASNYEGCQEKSFCVSAYNNLAIELMRALNFYRFSNPDSTLAGIWICGGGAGNETLCKVISETLDLEVHAAAELLPGKKEVAGSDRFLQAVGATLD